MDVIARLLRPRSVAVVGASADTTKTAGRTVPYLRKHGFTGDIYPVNPRVDSVDGLRCFPDVASLPAATMPLLPNALETERIQSQSP